jgi:hypothetical protein
MLTKGQILCSRIGSEIIKYSLIEVKNNKYICTAPDGKIVELSPDWAYISHKTRLLPIRVSGNRVGVLHNGNILYATEHAIERSITRCMIGERKSFVKFICSSLRTGEECKMDGLKRVIVSSKYRNQATYIVSKVMNSVLIIENNRIVTVYPISSDTKRNLLKELM